MSVLRFLFGAAAAAATTWSGEAAAPFRLFQMGATRFTQDAARNGTVESLLLNAAGEIEIVSSAPTTFTRLVPESVLGKVLIFTEAWHAYGQLGPEARANFRLANNESPIVLGSLLYYELEARPDAKTAVGAVVNLSTRGQVTAGATPTLIGGFVIENRSRRVLIRTVGPGLREFGVSDPLEDPLVVVQRGTTILHSGSRWGQRHDADAIAAAAAEVGAFPLVRTSADAALLVELPPGAYTAGVSSEGGGTGGSALLEIYVLP